MEKDVTPVEPNAEQIKLTEDLEKYMIDNLDRIKEWHRVHGLGVRPPILYDVALGRWFWASRARRRKITKQQGAQIEKDFTTILDPSGNPFQKFSGHQAVTDGKPFDIGAVQKILDESKQVIRKGAAEQGVFLDEEGPSKSEAHQIDPGASESKAPEEGVEKRDDTETGR